MWQIGLRLHCRARPVGTGVICGAPIAAAVAGAAPAWIGAKVAADTIMAAARVANLVMVFTPIGVVSTELS
jgi:hypothetical protein